MNHKTKDILDRIEDSSPNESSHELFCRLRDCAHEIETLRAALTSRPDAQADERDREILEVIDERDRFERDATELAEKVGQYLGVDVGEWSSANDPIIAAMEALDERVSVQQSAQADERGAFQSRVHPWMLACFGSAIAADTVERNHRFFEEASELVQACGMTASEAHQLIDYTWSRPIGEKTQEVGGAMVTLAALCLANGLDMHAAGETELARISDSETMAKIRAKQAAKPKHSPLPEARAAAPQADERYDLLQAAVNCPHEIESNRVVLHYSDKQPGHNALAQLRERLTRAAAPQAEAAQGVPDDVRAAVERMCAPLHESRLSGVTAQEDAWCMKLIRDYVLGTDAAAHSPDREQVGEAYPRPATSHCQNGGDVCLAGNRDGVCCPEDSCDIDDGVRKSPDASASRECGERQECHHGQDNGACGWCYDEAARGEQMAMNREDVERQYKDGIHIGSGLPRATCPCGLCSKHRFGFNSGGGVPIAAASASTLSERSECTCGNGLGHARHCPAFDESKMRYEPFALPQPQAAEPRGLTLEQREAIKWALGVAHSGAKATPEGLLMFNRWKALCALLSKGE